MTATFFYLRHVKDRIGKGSTNGGVSRVGGAMGLVWFLLATGYILKDDLREIKNFLVDSQSFDEGITSHQVSAIQEDIDVFWERDLFEDLRMVQAD